MSQVMTTTTSFTASAVVGDKTRSIAILIGANDAATGSGGKSSSSSSASLAHSSTPLVVWTLQERPSHLVHSELQEQQQQQQQQQGDDNDPIVATSSSHKYDLVYYEFLDDTARWTHLDQLLLQLCGNDSDRDTADGIGSTNTNEEGSNDDAVDKDDYNNNDDFPSLHIGTCENLEKAMMLLGKRKSREGDDNDGKVPSPSPAVTRMKRLVESMRSFLEDRLNLDGERGSTGGNTNNSRTHHRRCVHLHSNIPVQAHTVDAALAYLLLDNEQAKLAVRGNLQLAQPLIRQGLALWLQSQGLYGNTAAPGSGGGGGSATGADSTRFGHSLCVRCGNHDLQSHLVMDRTAAQAIHLLPPPNEGVASVVGGNFHTNSLFGLLSKPCLTATGKKLLHVWLRQPLTDLALIEERQEAVTELLGVSRDAIRDGLRAFGGSGKGQGPLTKLGSALAKYCSNDDAQQNGETATVSKVGDTRKALETLYQLYILASRQLPNMLDCMDGIEESPSKILRALHGQVSQLVSELSRSVGLAEAVLDMDQAPKEFLVKPEYSADLGELHEQMDAVDAAVQDEWNAIEDAWNDLGLSGSNSKKGGSMSVRLERVDDDSSWNFRLPSTNDSKNVNGLGKKIQTHRILKNGVYFSSLELRELSQQYSDLRDQYSKKSRQIVTDAMAIASTYATVVERTAETVGNLDVFSALAHTAAMSPNGYCKPTMTDSDDDGAGITVVGARHPCLEVQEGMDFIPNDVDLKFADAQLLVSGPNCGGKSVYIRSIGAIVCMAQIGSYVPCTSATINICHAILARVGAGDLQDRGISTFMAEMLEASSILKTATKRSLIIIDELGRGTSTFDGYGIARAILQYLMDEVGCLVVFATHFHELTHLKGVKNCHVTARKGNQGLTFLYEVRPGPCLESFGIQVAEMANMPRVAIEDAKKRAHELESFDSVNDGGTRWSDMTENQRKVARFAQLDLGAFLQETSSFSAQERKAKLQQLLAC